MPSTAFSAVRAVASASSACPDLFRDLTPDAVRRFLPASGATASRSRTASTTAPAAADRRSAWSAISSSWASSFASP